MIKPNKHEDLNYNILVLGADIIKLLKEESLTIEDVYQKIKHNKEINLERVFDALLFLFIYNFIDIQNGLITLIKEKNDIK